MYENIAWCKISSALVREAYFIPYQHKSHREWLCLAQKFVKCFDAHTWMITRTHC